jgi:hypothetical protein
MPHVCVGFLQDESAYWNCSKPECQEVGGLPWAGKTSTGDPNKICAVVKECKQHGYGIFVASGKSLSLGNSWMPQVQSSAQSAAAGLLMPEQLFIQCACLMLPLISCVRQWTAPMPTAHTWQSRARDCRMHNAASRLGMQRQMCWHVLSRGRAEEAIDACGGIKTGSMMTVAAVGGNQAGPHRQGRMLEGTEK